VGGRGQRELDHRDGADQRDEDGCRRERPVQAAHRRAMLDSDSSIRLVREHTDRPIVAEA
jgi:hypothetical protein